MTQNQHPTRPALRQGCGEDPVPSDVWGIRTFRSAPERQYVSHLGGGWPRVLLRNRCLSSSLERSTALFRLLINFFQHENPELSRLDEVTVSASESVQPRDHNVGKVSTTSDVSHHMGSHIRKGTETPRHQQTAHSCTTLESNKYA